MSTSSNRDQKKELPIYDPEGVDPQTNIAYEEVKIPMQDHITTTRRAFVHTWTSLKEAWLKLSGDTRSRLTGAAGNTRRRTNTTLTSLGVEDAAVLLRGSAYAGAAVTGLALARRKPLFIKTLYPLLGVGLVGGAFHREKLYAVYKKVIGGNMSSWQPNKSLKTSSVSGPSHKPTEAKEK